MSSRFLDIEVDVSFIFQDTVLEFLSWIDNVRRAFWRVPTKCLYGCDHKFDIVGFHLFVTLELPVLSFKNEVIGNVVKVPSNVKLTNSVYQPPWKIADHV